MRPTYASILGLKSITPEHRREFLGARPECPKNKTDLVEVTDLDVFFLYGAVKSGDLRVFKDEGGRLFAPTTQLLEAFKQDRYAYKALAERREDTIFWLSVSIVVAVGAALATRLLQ